MGLVLDRAALSESIRQGSGFREITLKLERDAERFAVQEAQIKGIVRDTGLYEDTFKAVFLPKTGGVTVLGKLRLSNLTPYAAVIELGSAPHVIQVRKAKVLYSKKTNRFFGVKVQHPGTRPRFVIRDALLRLARGGL